MNEKEVFGGLMGPAKVTIEVGDYKVSMEGHLDPPEFNADYEDIRIDDYGMTMLRQRATSRNFAFNVKNFKNAKYERIKWSVPIATPPRIEE